MFRFIALSLALLISVPVLAESSRLLRFPDIHGEQVAFVYAGDVYVAQTGGGVARQLTSHEGFEIFPKFSPDGNRIAFSAEYNGTRQIYVIPAAGGTPKQLTWYNDVGPMPPRGGFDYRVLDWTPDGKHILVRANRLPWGVRMGRYLLVPADGGDEIDQIKAVHLALSIINHNKIIAAAAHLGKSNGFHSLISVVIKNTCMSDEMK